MSGYSINAGEIGIFGLHLLISCCILRRDLTQYKVAD
jgi:hypothetical protein